MTFDPDKHPRGHPDNRGGFSERTRDADTVELTESGQWPSVGAETLEWQPATVIETGRGLGPRAERYSASVPATIATGNPQIPGHVAALAEDASFELTRFDAELGGEVTAFSAILLRSEAVASSQIENLSASARAILTAEIGRTSAANANAIAANTRSMRAAIDLSKELHPDSIRAMHRILMEHAPRHTPGEWRSEPVWIGTSATSPAGAEYVAPWHERVPALMDDLMAFVARDDLPILAQSAIAHAQFETIHPFTDGNGRTGRALIQSMLRGKGLTRSVTVPVSSGLLADIPAYHAALTSYQGGDTTPIIELAAQSSLRAVTNAKKLVGDIRATRDRWNQRVTARSDSAAWKVLDIIARQPVVSADTVAESLGIVETSAYRHLNHLVEAGILKRKSEHKIGILWRSDEILANIDAFANRAGHRGR